MNIKNFEVLIYGPQTGEKAYGVDYDPEKSGRKGIITRISEQEIKILKDQNIGFDEILEYIKDKLDLLIPIQNTNEQKQKAA